MKKTLFLFCSLLFLFSSTIYGANKPIKGRVLDIKQQPIPYVNLGIIESSIFTITDENGNFTLSIPDSISLNQRVCFRHLCYFPVEFSLSKFNSDSVTLIQLDPLVHSLPEMVVTSRSIKLKKIISKGIAFPGNGSIQFINSTPEDKNLGFEMGYKVNIRKEIQLNEFKFQICSKSIDSCLIRLNIYREDKEGQWQNYNTKPIYCIVYLENNLKEVTIDLNQKVQALQKDTYYIAIEFVNFYGCGDVTLPAYIGNSYIRDNSLDIMKRIPITMGASLDGYQVRIR